MRGHTEAHYDRTGLGTVQSYPPDTKSFFTASQHAVFVYGFENSIYPHGLEDEYIQPPLESQCRLFKFN